MEIALIVALVLSVLANVALVALKIVWKGRAMNVMEGIHQTNKRLGLTFNLLWKEAQSRGVSDKNEFTGKLIMLADVPEPLQEDMAEKIGLIPAKAQKTLGFQN